MSNNYAINLVILTLFATGLVTCEVPVTGRCGRPALPPHATKHLITPERSRFDNKEKVIIVCKKGEFVHHSQVVECRNGRWVGEHPRCAKHIEAEVNRLDISECDTPSRKRLTSQTLNQTPDSHEYGPLPVNAFHALRVPLSQIVSTSGHNCYKFDIGFNKKVQIWFLTVDIWYKNNENKSNGILEMKPNVGKYRTCEEKHVRPHDMGNDTVVGYYFFCDLKNDSYLKEEESEPMDEITLNIKTNFTEDIGLEAVFIGSIYQERMGSMLRPDCGDMETKNLGVDLQEETNYKYISCNDSFVDLTGHGLTSRSKSSGNPQHKFICNNNGVWVGEWPQCEPKISCPNEEIYNIDSSVTVEEVGNVYFFNESQWKSFSIGIGIRVNCLLILYKLYPGN